VAVHVRGSRINLLDSALPAPQASFGGHGMYPEFLDQAAVLAVRTSRNQPLLDGNKRLAWGCLVMFCVLNGHDVHVPTEEAVSTMLSLAAGDLDERGWPNGSPCGLIEKTDQPTQSVLSASLENGSGGAATCECTPRRRLGARRRIQVAFMG
jgi:death on curing protein